MEGLNQISMKNVSAPEWVIDIITAYNFYVLSTMLLKTFLMF